MSITTSIKATVKNGKIVLPPGVELPDGTVVRIKLVKENAPTIRDVPKEFDGIATDLPVDMAANHDHYIHGHPKKELPTLLETMKDFVGVAKGLPPDLAANHDHYLHGHRKA